MANVITSGLGGIAGPAVSTFQKGTTKTSSDSPFEGRDYAWWIGQDGNVWAQVEGIGGVNVGSYKDLTSRAGGSRANSEFSKFDKSKQIEDPALAKTDTTTQVDDSAARALAAANAEKARRASEAANIKGRALGRRAEFTDILNGILKNIEDVYGEESSKRKETLDKDSAELISQLEKAIPGIGASFAAIGAYDSSWNNDAQADTKEEHNKAQEELESEYNEDLKTLGNKRNEAITGAKTSYQNFMTDFDALNETTANSDNLESIRQSENSLLKGLNNFKAQGDYYKPGSQLQSEMAGLGNYNGQKAIDAFGSFLSTAGAGGAAGAKAGGAEVAAAAKKNGKEKSELEQNKATGVSK